MTEKELMLFAYQQSTTPVIKNPILQKAMDQGPRTNFDDGGKVDEALDAYNYYLKTRKSRPSKKRYKEIPFTKFFEIYGRENFVKGGKSGNRYGQFTGDSMKNISDAILKSYADDDITFLFEKNKQNPTGLISSKDAKQGIFSKLREDPSRIDYIVKNTGLDEETIFDILDDRTAYMELEKGSSSQATRFKDRNKFFNKAEKWLLNNSKRYSDPVKFEKAFKRTFGKDNLITQTIKDNITDSRGKGRISGFSDGFVSEIMSSNYKQGLDPTKTRLSFNSTQLKDMFKTVIYNNNPNVRKKITKAFENIIPEAGSKRTPDIRKLFQNDPILKKFGLDKSITGPIARLIANEINEDLLTNVKNFQKPFLGTDALLSYLKDRVDPKYKEMFKEASNAVKQAQKNQWPAAKKSLHISQGIMFDHKIPKALIEAGYADDIEYIKLNPTSEKFNATIKRSQFDQPMIKLTNEFEKTKSLDGKAKVVKKMNILKDNFSKKYKGYLDEVTITPDKTGKPIFKSSAAPVTKQTDFVSALGKSMVQTGEITEKQQIKMIEKLKFHPDTKKKMIKIGCGMYAGGRVGLKNGSGACIAKALKKMDNPKNLSAVESRLAKEVISESKKLAKAGSWIKGDLYFGAAEMLNNWSKGQGFLRGLNNAVELATFGAVDVEADENALYKLIGEQGSKEDQEAFADYLDAAKKFNTLDDAEKGLIESQEVADLAKKLGPKDGVFFPIETEGALNANKRSVKEREEIAMKTLEKTTLDKGYKLMNEYMERLAAQDWNKTAGTVADRGIREMVGAKGDEGLIYGLGFGFDKFKKYRPQDTMNYHPVYGYKENLKKEMRRGNSPMEDILYSMDEYGPDNLLQLEAGRTENLNDENVDMGIYDYNEFAEGGLASLKRKK